MGNTVVNAAHDPFNSDAISEYYHIQSTEYAGSYADVTAPAAANYPVVTPTRYFIFLPLTIDVSDLAGSRPCIIKDVDTATVLTRVSGAPGANQFRIPASTSIRRNVVELHSGQAGHDIGFDYYGIEFVINADSFETSLNLNGSLQVGEGENIGTAVDADLLELNSGTLTINGDLLVDGNNIGITTDTNLITLAANELTIDGDLIVNNEIGIVSDPDLIVLGFGSLIINGALKRGSSGEYLEEKTLTIASWNMDTNGNSNVAHGISNWAAIRSVSVVITNNAGTAKYDLCVDNGGYSTWGSAVVAVYRTAGGIFDDPAFNNASVTIHVKWNPI